MVKTVNVIGNQSVVLNFDIQSISGLVRAQAVVNGNYSTANIQFCSTTGNCTFNYNDGPFFEYWPQSPSYAIPMAVLPGDYIMHVKSSGGIDLGTYPITVVAGQVIEVPTSQFSVSFGKVIGSVTWGSEVPSTTSSDFAGLVQVKFVNNDTGFTYNTTDNRYGLSYDTGYSLPEGTYTATAKVRSNIQNQLGAVILVQTVEVLGNQSVTLNFDIQSVSGLVRSQAMVNGSTTTADMQFCSTTGNCSFNYNDGPFFEYWPQSPSYSIPMAVLPGDYIMHVRSSGGIDLGTYPITVTAGNVIEVPTSQFSVNYGKVSGRISWGTEIPSAQSTDFAGGVVMSFVNNNTGFTYGTSYNFYGDSYDTGYNLPEGTYTATAKVRSNNQNLLGAVTMTETINVIGGQNVELNFDAETISGLVKAEMSVVGNIIDGDIQFCSLTGNCTFNYNDGPMFSGDRSNHILNYSTPMAVLPGDYIVHARSASGIDLGKIQITIGAGQIIDLRALSISVPTGQNVSVSLGGVNVTFTEVTSGGYMQILETSHPQGGNPPSQYRFLGTYYELTATATYTGPITVSFTYDDTDVHGQESNLKLFHWDSSTWQNITNSLDTTLNIITGVTDTLSPFAIGDLLNQPPTVSAGGPYEVDEGSTVDLSATGSDPDGGALTYVWDLDNDGSYETSGQNVTFSANDKDGPSAYTLKVQVTDEAGTNATDVATVTVHNMSPSLGTINAPIDPVNISNEVTVTVDLTDLGSSDTHTATWDWGDTTTSEGVISNGTVTGNHTYTAPGVYTLKVSATDDDGASVEQFFQFIVIYDPEGGFVTGGGWIDSPEGAYTDNSSYVGKANFGFVSKYENGANIPTGQTKFQFKVADLKFDSTSYDWLVVAGPNAKYKGEGTINGDGEYGFMLTGNDGDINGGGGTDRFRIKIWDKVTEEVVYDNQLGDSEGAEATDAIEGGSIVIHNH